jgi:hypothetical protein
MFGLGLRELAEITKVLLVIFGIPAGIVAFIMILAKSRQRRQLRHQ